jgi:gliding motility-associated-like protein
VIRGILNFPGNTFEIFNRWGDKVFEATPYKNTWDGRAAFGVMLGGDELPIGTYFYILDLQNGSPVYKGTIYLNR